MKMEVSLEINCGELTCAEEPGKFCRFLKWTLNGRASCWLFGETLDDSSKKLPGWTMRCRSCIDTAKPVKSE